MSSKETLLFISAKSFWGYLSKLNCYYSDTVTSWMQLWRGSVLVNEIIDWWLLKLAQCAEIICTHASMHSRWCTCS